MSDEVEKHNAAERREARRRRILENLDNRLKKITDMTPPDDNNDKPFKFMPNGKEYSARSHNINVTSKAQLFESPEPRIQVQPEALITDPWNYTSKPSNVIVQENKYASLFMSQQSYLVILALATYILLRFNVGYIFCESIMVPFYTLEFAQLIIQARKPKTGIASMLIAVLGMYGVSSRVLSTVADIITLALGLCQDLCLYLFVVILASALF